MGKYIDADELKKVFLYSEDAEYTRWTLSGVIGEIDDIEAADVVEVRHGRWEWKEDLKAEDENGWFIREQGYVCSECGFIGSDNFRYCPNCGAKMDEEDTNANETL